MGVPAYLVRRFGGIDRVPDYIKRHFERRTQMRDDAARAARERREREHARIKALRRPPARVWRVGYTVLWEPPETLRELRPLGYWLSEQRHGQWTAHGDYLPEPAREGRTFGLGPVRVEVKYDQQALGEVYVSPSVSHHHSDDPVLISRIRFYASETHKGRAHCDRWRRVLAAFGVREAKVGWAGRPPVGPLEPAITLAEAQRCAARGWRRWVPVADALRRRA